MLDLEETRVAARMCQTQSGSPLLFPVRSMMQTPCPASLTGDGANSPVLVAC